MVLRVGSDSRLWLYINTIQMAEYVDKIHMTRLPFESGTGRILVTQVVVTLIGTLAFAFAGIVSAYSALLGGIACLIPSAYSIWRIFGKDRRLSPYDSRTFGIMLRTELVKITITAIVFVAIFWLVDTVDPVAMFSVFAAALFIGWIEAGLRIR